jgi:hypothetical protein
MRKILIWERFSTIAIKKTVVSEKSRPMAAFSVTELCNRGYQLIHRCLLFGMLEHRRAHKEKT